MSEMLNIALPKGRLGEKVYDMFEKAGFDCPSIRENSRKLIFENAEAGVRYFCDKLHLAAFTGKMQLQIFQTDSAEGMEEMILAGFCNICIGIFSCNE